MKQPKINWRVRAKKPTFWIAIVSASLVLAQIVGSWFGVTVPVEFLEGEATSVINTVFLLLTFLGIIEDHTTADFGDSEQALRYDKPRKDGE